MGERNVYDRLGVDPGLLAKDKRWSMKLKYIAEHRLFTGGGSAKLCLEAYDHWAFVIHNTLCIHAVDSSASSEGEDARSRFFF